MPHPFLHLPRQRLLYAFVDGMDIKGVIFQQDVMVPGVRVMESAKTTSASSF